MRAIAVRLKIPDNEAYTALAALRRLGVSLAQLERAELWLLDDTGDESDLADRFERNERLYNPNKHRLELLHADAPRAGELWIEPLDSVAVDVRIAGVRGGRRLVGWRLFTVPGEPAPRAVLERAASLLLCNPAIEKVVLA